MPLPDRSRFQEYALKGVHLALRQRGLAPEQRAARALAAQAVPAAAGGPHVAFLSPRDWAAHVHWESMMGHALQQRGARVSFMTCGGGLEICDRVNTWEGPPMPCRSCTRYVEDSIDAHGFGRVALRDGWDATDTGWPELDAVALDGLPGVTAPSGAPLGLMTEIPVKWFLMRTDLDNEPLAAPTWRSFLRSARRIEQGVEAALDRLQPDVVMLLNGLFLFESVAWEVCRRRGIDVVTYERGMIKETLVVERNSPACLFDLDRPWVARRARPLDAVEEARLDGYLDDRRHGRRTIDQFWGDADFDDTTDSGGDGRFVTLFTNLTWDSAVIGRERAFGSIQEWLGAAVSLFAERPQDTLVIRIHPAEVKLPGKQTREPMREVIEREVGPLPPNVRLVEATDPQSSYPLMERSDLGLVYTSTTGLELALRGIPTVVAGETHYRRKGFTLDVDDPDEFRSVVTAALDDPRAHQPDRDLARRYAHLFFFEAPVGSPGVEEHVQGLVRLTTDDLADLAPGADPDVDRICDLILHDPDAAASSAA